MSQYISTEIEILAPPATVHSIVRMAGRELLGAGFDQPVQFMDFSRWKEWSSWNVKPVDPNKNPSDLKAEDPIDVDIKAMQFRAFVVVSSQ